MSLFTKRDDATLRTVTPQFLVDLIKEDGFTAERETLQSGSPMVRFKVEGFNCQIFFYGDAAPDGGYASLQIRAGFRDKISIERANEWNKTKRFPKLYSDDDGELAVEMELEIEGGVTKEFLQKTLARWRRALLASISWV